RVVADDLRDLNVAHGPGGYPHRSAVTLHGHAGDRLRHGHRPGRHRLRLNVVPGSSDPGDETGAGDRDRRRGDQAAHAPDPAAGYAYRTHGRSTVSRVGPPGGLTISKVPS